MNGDTIGCEPAMQPPTTRAGFEIAIICALKKERDAIEAVMDIDFQDVGKRYGKASRDRNAYTTGVLGGQAVVVAYPRDIGNLNAATVVSDMRFSFVNIKLVLVVGVAGGAPNTPAGVSIHLGDVVISKVVIQYDFGRQYPNTFQRKTAVADTFGRANTEISQFIAKLEGQRAVRRMTGSMRHTIKQACPTSQDILFPAEYRHKHRSLHNCDICNRCVECYDPVCEAAEKASCEVLGCLQHRSDRETQASLRITSPGPVQIHFGSIASGNAVLKSGIHRDKLVTMEGVIGFEMEGAGTWDHIPTIIVKSICDYADGHKGKIWQDYAAATAAACAKAMLAEWESHDQSPK